VKTYAGVIFERSEPARLRNHAAPYAILASRRFSDNRAADANRSNACFWRRPWDCKGGTATNQPRRLPLQRRDINAADAPTPAGQYTQAVEMTGATRTLYVSGQVGVAADGRVPEDAETQSLYQPAVPLTPM
jgi:hypothetical protein